ncbi:MucR family transcriptional regulator [Methylorubrum zatmanii]
MIDDTGPSDGSMIIMATANIVEEWLRHSSLPASHVLDVLPELVRRVSSAFYADEGTAVAPAAAAETKPINGRASAEQIEASITPDALISFVDGKPYKTLKRHLGTHGLDPASYRRRYGLPKDYPMVAASYSEQRAALAKAIGLGQPKGQPRTAA